MFKQTLTLLTLSILSTLSAAQNATTQKVGWSGKLSSLDGGLGGTVTVISANSLQISDYTLKDASAPKLYWWGTTDGVIKDGFRISNEQITTAATTNSLTIMLDAGKTTADFDTVGLWCERLNANFGQATLKAADGTTATTTSAASASASSTSGSPSATASTSGAGSIFVSYGIVITMFFGAIGFASYMG